MAGGGPGGAVGPVDASANLPQPQGGGLVDQSGGFTPQQMAPMQQPGGGPGPGGGQMPGPYPMQGNMTGPAGAPQGGQHMVNTFGMQGPPGETPQGNQQGGGQQPQQPMAFAPMPGNMQGQMGPYPMGAGEGGQQGGPQQVMYPGGYVLQAVPGGNPMAMMVPGGMVQGMQQVSGQPGQGQPGMPPGGMQLVMVPGPGQQPQMMPMGPGGPMPGGGQMPGGMQVMPAQAMHGHPGGQDGQGGSMMMMTGPSGTMGTQPGEHGRGGPGGNQGSIQGPMLDGGMDGKGGSRVAALSRSTQPKQGSWGQHGGRGRGGPADMPNNAMAGGGPMGGGMRAYGDGFADHHGQMPQMQQQMPCQGFPGQVPPKAAGPMLPQSSMPGDSSDPSASSVGKLKNQTKMRKPERPWADVHDSTTGIDDEMMKQWHIRPGMDSNMMHGMPKQGMGMVSPSQQMGGGRGKGNRDRGGKGMDQGGKGGQQETEQKWVVRQPESPSNSKGGGKGQQRQNQWEPKVSNMVPKAAGPQAPIPAQHMSTAPLMPQSLAKGGARGTPHVSSVPPVVPAPAAAGPPPGGNEGGNNAGAGGGKKKNVRRDPKMEDWLSARFAGMNVNNADSTTAGGGDGNLASGVGDDGDAQVGEWGEADEEYEFDGEGGDARRGKRKGGKGNKGKGEKRGGDKGKGKGKGGRGAYWKSLA